MDDERTVIIQQHQDLMRLDRALAELLAPVSRSRIEQLIHEGRVLKAGSGGEAAVKKPGEKVRAGAVYLVRIPEAVPIEAAPRDIPLDILYEDGDVIVVNKPKGMVVHPDTAHRDNTLVNALLFHCRDLSGIGGVERPGIVHRIDMDTTGSVIACKNDRSHASIAAQLKEHSINRVYIALVCGSFRDEEGTVDLPLGRSERDRKKIAVKRPGEGKRAVTHYRVLERLGGFTLLECRLETGRTHQIRVHMAHIGHPLLGDEVYGCAGINRKFGNLQGQCLHAMTLGFVHPVSGEYIEVNAPLPEYFEKLLVKLRGEM